MANYVEYVQTIDHAERLNNSVKGNPRWRLFYADGQTALTQSDASVGYEIGNPNITGVPVEIKATRAGRVRSITPVSQLMANRYRDHPDRLNLVICGECSTRSTLAVIYRNEIPAHNLSHASHDPHGHLVDHQD